MMFQTKSKCLFRFPTFWGRLAGLQTSKSMVLQENRTEFLQHSTVKRKPVSFKYVFEMLLPQVLISVLLM